MLYSLFSKRFCFLFLFLIPLTRVFSMEPDDFIEQRKTAQSNLNKKPWVVYLPSIAPLDREEEGKNETNIEKDIPDPKENLLNFDKTPENTFLSNLGCHFGKKEEDKKAIEYFEFLINDTPVHFSILWNLKMAHERLGNSKNMMYLQRELDEMKKEEDTTYQSLLSPIDFGILHFYRKEYQKSIDFFRHHLEDYPEELIPIDTLKHMFYSYEALSQWKEAIIFLKKVEMNYQIKGIENIPVEIYYNLAKGHLKLGEFSQALLFFETCRQKIVDSGEKVPSKLEQKIEYCHLNTSPHAFSKHKK